MSIYVDFHVLQTVPPCCINRDDIGRPKTAVYGGQTRARVSSQAWKHAIRDYFKSATMDEYSLADRTQNLREMVLNECEKMGKTISAKDVQKALEEAGIKFNDGKKDAKKEGKCEALFFMGRAQARTVAEIICDDSIDKSHKDKYKKLLQDAISKHPAIDIALFGRMVASETLFNIDATAQVAHAISTHSIMNEYDYFTAVDDLQSDEISGAGHLGTVEFNSSTLYRYANINITELAKLIGRDEAADAVAKFTKAFICSMPTGKENTFANRTLPDCVYITIRDDQPVNLCSAFEAPVKKSAEGFAKASEAALVAKAKDVYSKFAAEPRYALCIGEDIKEIAEYHPLNELIETLKEDIMSAMEM